MARFVEKIALVGAGGSVGSHFAAELIKIGKQVTGLTRSSSNTKLPTGVTPVPVNYDDEQSLVAALRGHDFLIVTLSVRAPPDLQTRIVQAAAKAGVPFVMPNAYSNDLYNSAIPDDVPIYDQLRKQIASLKTIGPPIIPVVCGFWYEFSLAQGESCFGFDIRNRKVTFFDDGHTKVNVSTWNQCGRAIAALLSLPIDGVSPSITDWTERPLYFSSFEVSQRDILDSLNRVLGTADPDWSIAHEPSKERCQRGIEELQKGNFGGIAINMYSRVFYPSEEDTFQRHSANKTLGLPKEDLDEATKRAVHMVESGWNPYR